MKRLLAVVFIGCVLVGCGKKDINSLPAECQTALEKWDIYTDMLASDNKVSREYVESTRKAKEIHLESMFRRKNKDQLTQECKEITHIIKEYMRIFKARSQEFY